MQLLCDYGECMDAVVRLFRTATSRVLYSTFLCKMDIPLATDAACSMRELIAETLARGVRVTLLYNPGESYGNAPLREFMASLPAECEVYTCVGNGRLHGWQALLTPHGVYSYMHQKFLLADNSALLLGGCDVDEERQRWGHLNVKKYYWHDCGVLWEGQPLPPALLRFLCRKRTLHTSVPRPLVRGAAESSALCYMIRTAQASIHMEQQMFISVPGHTCNGVGAALVDRVAQAHTSHTPFHAVIITNYAHPDEPALIANFLYLLLAWSFLGMTRYAAEKYGLSPQTLDEHLLFVYLVFPDGPVKVHSNLTIRDGGYALRSSSNLTDRSLSDRPCDLELGLIFPDAAHAQQRLWHRYIGSEEGEASDEAEELDAKLPLDAVGQFRAVQQERGALRNLSARMRADSLLRAFDTLAMARLLRALHSHPIFGGKKRIAWRMRRGKRGRKKRA